jgi:phenylalanyl-tRNA synthetase beta chain
MRGLESQGMLCSIDELGLDAHDQPGADADGILILDDSFAIGADAVDALMLRDTSIEFEITNNRPDCLSVIGLARETAASLGAAHCQIPATGDAVVRPQGDGINDYLTVTVEDAALCPRYSAQVATNIKIAPSPMWMRRRLRACGVRPINNIVDITNYVMLETGQPMHAFDHACVRDRQLVIRTARPGETLETLDGKLRTLEPSMLVIADAHDAAAVAGVMGGAGSEISGNTTDIVFESANFDGPSVRKTALSLAMRTDSSTRFEKGLDPGLTVYALKRACRLVAELNAGTVVPGVIDICVPPKPPVKVIFTQEQIERHLGVEIPRLNVLLGSLGFIIEGGTAIVPSWRRDVSIWQDLAEEAARLHGYGNIPATLPPSKNQGWLTKEQALRAQLHDLCVSLGFYEILTYSFIGPADFEAARLPSDGAKTLRNALGEEHSIMRTSLLPSLLQALSRNAAVRNPETRLYELSKVYTDTGDQLPLETYRLILGGYGQRDAQDDGMSFFTLKGAVEELLCRFCRKGAAFIRTEEAAMHPGRCASVSIDGRILGMIGELHPALGYPSGAAVCELDAEFLLELAQPDAVFSPLPRFPAISRDLALVVPKGAAAADVLGVIRKAGGALLEDCALFDVYEAKNSLAYRLTFRAADRTLTDDEADGTVKRILKKLQDALDVTLRA